jgi:predicted CXXCH cytochrome family protein
MKSQIYYNHKNLYIGGSMRVLGFLLLFLVVPVFVYAAGAHDGLNCVGCHGIHTAKGEIIFAVEPNKKSVNPKTKSPYAGTTALCLGCHETIDKGGMGIMPVSSAMSHPYGVAPNLKVASVPDVFLREGKLECVGCHDPHPSNPNYKYLRVDTKKGGEMRVFCAVCHSSKADVAAKDIKVFNSMDEMKRSQAAPMEAPLAPKAAPAAAPKR